MSPKLPIIVNSIQYAFRYSCRILLLAAMIAGGILFGVDLFRFMVNSSDFTVQEITVFGNKRIDEGSILALAGIVPGTNIWLVNLEALAKQLESHPRIRRVGIQRIPPRRIHILIDERTPLVFILNPENNMLYGLDADGVMLPPIMGNEHSKQNPERQDEDIRLVLSQPIMSGDLAVTFEPGAKVTDAKILEGLRLLQRLEFSDSAMFGDIAEAEWQSSGNFVLHFRRRIGVAILRDLGSPEIEKKFKAFWNLLETKNLRAIYVDARFPYHGFAVRWDESDGAQWRNLYHSDTTLLSQAERVK